MVEYHVDNYDLLHSAIAEEMDFGLFSQKGESGECLETVTCETAGDNQPRCVKKLFFISFSSNHANEFDHKVCIPLYFRPMVRASRFLLSSNHVKTDLVLT